MNAPFLPRVLRSYQEERAATFLYEHDAAFLVAPLRAGKGAAALTRVDPRPYRRHLLALAQTWSATVWPQEVASWPHLRHLRVAVLNGNPERRRVLLRAAAEREVTVIGVDLVPWLVASSLPLAMITRSSTCW